MRTDKQIEASRRNGAKSKGPITEEAKPNPRSTEQSTGYPVAVAPGSSTQLARRLYQELLTHYITFFAPVNG
jgi:hypothetical protein